MQTTTIQRQATISKGPNALAEPPREISEAEIRGALQRGRRLRSRIFRRVLRKVYRTIGEGFAALAAGRPRKDADNLEHHLMTSLTALRSSAEILRDHPEIGRADRQRFLQIVLSEEARLERLLRSVLNRMPTA